MKRNQEMVRINRPAATPPAAQTIAYSIAQLAGVIPIGRTMIYEEIRAGRLRKAKIGRRTVILADEVERWLSAHAASTVPTRESSKGSRR